MVNRRSTGLILELTMNLQSSFFRSLTPTSIIQTFTGKVSMEHLGNMLKNQHAWIYFTEILREEWRRDENRKDERSRAKYRRERSDEKGGNRTEEKIREGG